MITLVLAVGLAVAVANAPSAGAPAGAPAGEPAADPAAPWRAGRYRLDVVTRASTAVPFVGASVTRSVSLLDIDIDGGVVQRTCAIVTTGRGYRVDASEAAVAALPVQRFRFVVVDGIVVGDAGPLRFGDGDDDNDGATGVAFLLHVDGVGRFTVQVQGGGHTVLRGARTAAGAAGRVEVLESRQRVLSGLPIAVSGDARVDEATFTLTRVADDVACPASAR